MKNEHDTPNALGGLSPRAMQNPIKVRYTNYCGQTAVRTIIPLHFWFGSTEDHQQQQWLLQIWDVQKNAERTYALKDISQWFTE